MKVYRVFTTGADNDDSIHGIFSTREGAETFARVYADHHQTHPDNVEIDEWILDEPEPCNCWRVKGPHHESA